MYIIVTYYLFFFVVWNAGRGNFPNQKSILASENITHSTTQDDWKDRHGDPTNQQTVKMARTPTQENMGQYNKCCTLMDPIRKSQKKKVKDKLEKSY